MKIEERDSEFKLTEFIHSKEEKRKRIEKINKLTNKQSHRDSKPLKGLENMSFETQRK